MGNIIKVKVNSVKIGSKVSEDVKDKNGNVIVKKDETIDEVTRDLLIINGIGDIYIYNEVDVIDQQDIQTRVDRIFNKVNNEDFMKRLRSVVLEFRIKYKL